MFIVFCVKHHPEKCDWQLLSWPQISWGVKKFILELFLVFPGLDALQRGLPKVLRQVTTILRCQQGSFRPAKSGFWRLQNSQKTIDLNPKPEKNINPYFFWFFTNFAHLHNSTRGAYFGPQGPILGPRGPILGLRGVKFEKKV